VKEENQVNIFTDFKRINETHFWSETRQFWLTSFELQAEFFNQDFLFFDEVQFPFATFYRPWWPWKHFGDIRFLLLKTFSFDSTRIIAVWALKSIFISNIDLHHMIHITSHVKSWNVKEATHLDGTLENFYSRDFWKKIFKISYCF